MRSAPDGIYAVYLAALAGEGLALLLLSGGRITGADAAGGKFDGVYRVPQDTESFDVYITVSIEPNGTLIQGQLVGDQGLRYTVNFQLPENFVDLPYISVDTPYGKVNAKFVRLRGL